MDQSNDTVVMKFGGTSVGTADAIRRLVGIVANERHKRLPIVVVSAMSRVTDALLSAVGEAERGNETGVAEVVAGLESRHRDTARAMLGHRSADLACALGKHVDQMRAVLSAISILRDASPRSIDAVAATGELLSSRLVAAALHSSGIESEFVDARRVLITDENYGCAAPLMAPTEAALEEHVVPILQRGAVPVIGGYIGATEQGVTTTLGRGGSDYSAAIVGAALGTTEVQIWTDVDGMLSGDPRVIDTPILVPQLSFEEASELAYFGAKVLHPSTILPAMRRNIPVRILNSHRPENAGTRITRETSTDHRPVTAIACKRGVTVLDVTSTRMLMAHGFLRRVFEVFEQHRTAVDVVTTSEVSVSMTVDDNHAVEAIATALRSFADVSVAPNMAILCAVGDALRRDSRLAARVVAALQTYPIAMVSQAASRRNLTIVMPDAEIPSAMARLHAEFFAELAV